MRSAVKGNCLVQIARFIALLTQHGQQSGRDLALVVPPTQIASPAPLPLYFLFEIEQLCEFGSTLRSGLTRIKHK